MKAIDGCEQSTVGYRHRVVPQHEAEHCHMGGGTDEEIEVDGCAG